MEKSVLELAIKLPHAFPWERELSTLSREQVEAYLKKYKLSNEEDRRELAWKIEIECAKEAFIANSKEELVKRVLETLKDEKYITKDTVNMVLRRKFIQNDEELRLFQDFIKKELSLDMMIKNKRALVIWIGDLMSYYYLTNKNSQHMFNDISKAIDNVAREVYDIKLDFYNIEKAIKSKGLKNTKVINLFIDKFSDKKDLFKDLVSSYISDRTTYDVINSKMNVTVIDKADNKSITENKSNKVDSFDLADSLMDMFNNMDTSNDSFEIHINENKDFQVCEEAEVTVALKETIENVDEIKKEILILEEKESKEEEVFNNLKALVKSLGYRVVKSSDKVLSKEKYNNLLKGNNSNEQLFKKMCDFKEDAVFSELYNIYKDINNVSKENIEAVLCDLFNNLSRLGLEVDSEEKILGQSVKVNTKDALKDFVFSNPVDKEGEVEGTVKYFSWTYKGKKLIPMVIKPNKK